MPELRQPFVDMLWRFYLAARRPPTRQIAATIERWDEDQRRGTANHETIRRTLRGETVGSWLTVEMIFLALCEIADVDPHDLDGDDGDQWNRPLAHIDRLHRYWNEALDQAPMLDLPRTRGERATQEAAEAEERAKRAARGADPWDAPPF